MDKNKNVFTKLKGLSKKENNSSLNTQRQNTREANPAILYEMPDDNFNHSFKHHEDIQEFGDELNNIERTFMNEYAMHLIDLLSSYVKNESLSKTTRYFALEQIFRSSVTSKLIDQHLSKEEREIHTNQALAYLFACLSPNPELTKTLET
tara:strand:- start:42 stop:491 length:450 start_codon:yes stop_codon:yes gene_type:complete